MTERESNYVLFNIPFAIICVVILTYIDVGLSYNVMGWCWEYGTLTTSLSMFSIVFILDLVIIALLKIFTKKMIIVSAVEVLFALLLLLAIIS